MKKQNKIYVPHQFFSTEIRLYPNWITNRHFLIHRSLIKNDYDFESKQVVSGWIFPYSLNDEDESNILEMSNESSLSGIWSNFDNPMMIFSPTTARVKINSVHERGVRLQCGGTSAFIAEGYFDALSMENTADWYSQGPTSPFFNAAIKDLVTLVVMPLGPTPYLEAMGKAS